MKISPISTIVLEGREFLVKRDDLIDKYLAGNKFRKLYSLLQTSSKFLDTIISYGGTQSNAMLAIAAMCKDKGWKFIYYTKPISEGQRKETFGNYALSKSLGMQHIELDYEIYKEFISSLSVNLDTRTYLLHQGGADESAKHGLKALAQEIKDASLDVDAIATPSGTGTTALYLALALPEYTIYTTPCVGDAAYLKTQMSALENIPKNLIILEPKKKYHFANPYKDFLEMYRKLEKAGIEFDLLYAPAMWIALQEQTTEKILYVHSGGVSGNGSMLERYQRVTL